MAKARATVAGAPGARTSFRGYAVLYSEEKPPHWTAQQTLEVRGADGQAVFDLVGRQQALGLALGGLWLGDLRGASGADAAGRHAEGAADISKQATEGARALGMEVDRFQSVSLNNAPGAMPMARAETAGAAPMVAPMPPPNATPKSQDVIVFVSAEVVLTMPAPAP